ncbi:MAG: hypothetical protein Q9173_003875 [Seirophora scorigena]
MEDKEERTAGLKMLAEKALQTPINPKHMRYCPSMDLLALATTDQQIHVFRTKGQRVFGVSRKEPSDRIVKMTWKPNGNVMYEKDALISSESPICYIGWTTNLTAIQHVQNMVSQFEDSMTLDAFIASTKEAKDSRHVPDLPNELAFIDVMGTLPKLATLPIGGSRGDVFSSRLALDTLFKPMPTGSTQSAEVLIVGLEDGTIQLSMSEDFSIGTFRLGNGAPNLNGSKPFLHCSHPLSTTHAFLVSASTGEAEDLQVVPFDLRLISGAGRHLSLLASKVTEMHNLLRYLQQAQEHISAEIKATQELPRKFMRNIDETLQEKSDCTWVQAAYHLVVTGHCHPEVKEWLVDELGERGHKRWDKAVTTGYESIRRLTHENLLPALDRLSVHISRLRGLSRYQNSDLLLGLSTPELDNIVDSVNGLQLLSNQLLKCTISESRQFGAFSTWLRHEIEKQATEPTSATAQELAQKDMAFDYTSILDYIQGGMTKSRMPRYSGNPMDSKPQWDIEAERGMLFELYKNQMQEEENSSPPRKQLPGLNVLIHYLQKLFASLFDHISETQRRNVHFGMPIYLGAGNSDCADMIMISETIQAATSSFSVFVAVGPLARETSVKIFHISLSVDKGVSTSKEVQCARIPTPPGAVRDIKFVDDEILMLAFTGLGGKSQINAHSLDIPADHWPVDASRLLKIYYRPRDRFSSSLLYRAYRPQWEENSTETHSIDLRNPKEVAARTIHRFPAGKAWAPQRMEINGRKGRRILCLLAEDNLHYRQYAIDSLDGRHVSALKQAKEADVATLSSS